MGGALRPPGPLRRSRGLTRCPRPPGPPVRPRQRCVALVSSQPALAPVLEGTVDALLALLPVHEHVPTVLADMCALAVSGRTGRLRRGGLGPGRAGG